MIINLKVFYVKAHIHMNVEKWTSILYFVFRISYFIFL